MKNFIFLLSLIFIHNSFAVSWIEQLGLKERASAPTTQSQLGQVWVEGASKDLMFRDSDGNDFNILMGGSIGGAKLNDLADVDTYTASPTAGNFLKYNGSLWVPASIPIISKLDDVGDVNAPTPTEGQVLTRVGSEWQAKDSAGGASFVGCVTVPTYTDNGSGNITVNTVDAVLFDNTTQVGTAKKYTLAPITVTLTDGVTNYVVADYNSGTPILKVITNVALITESDVAPVFTIFRSGSFLHALSWDSLGNGLANKVHQSIVKTQKYRRESGLALSESGTRNVNVGSGIVWVGGNSISVLAAASATDNMFYFLRTGAATWTTQVVTQYNNTDFWNGTTTASLTNNRYAVNWVYRGVESQKHLYVVLGEGDYTLPQAQASQPPANLPSTITSHAMLVGRVIVLKGASTATQIDSAFNLTFAGSGVTDHNSLINLQGGTTGEYYHNTAAQNTAMGTLSSTTTNYVMKRSATGFADSLIYDSGTLVGIGNAAPETKLHVTGDVTVTGYFNFGSPTANGSFRMSVSGGALVIEKRISGVWTTVGSFDEL